MNKMQTIHPWLVWRRKILMTMKLGVCFLLCTVFQVSARVTAQNERMNFKMHDASLKTILWALEKKSEMVFFYSVKDIEQVTGIDVVAENKTLDEILSEVLKNTGITYEVTHNTVVLRKGKVNAALPQSKTSEVTGKVTDRSGSPLPGVTILIKGTSLGTVTDTEGIFKIALPQKKDVVLVFSFIGMKTQEIVLKDDKPLKVVMQEDAKEIDEVVVTGIFNRKKDSFTGASATFDGEQLRSVGTQNVIASLKTLDPSFNVLENNEFGSDPNKLPDIEIRGKSSLISTRDELSEDPNQPLFILDGFESSLEAIYNLDMSRVASITILKDAASTAIYGSKASNGVVVVETIRPKSGKLNLAYNGNANVSWADLSSYNLMDASEKLRFENLVGRYDASNDVVKDVELKKSYYDKLADIARGVNTYWLDKPLQTAFQQRHTVTLEGGDEALRYRMYVGYNNSPGVMKDSKRDVLTGSLDFQYRLKKVLLKNSITLDNSVANESPWGSFSEYTRLNPYLRPYGEDGEIQKRLDNFEGIGGDSNYLNPMYNTTFNSKDQSKNFAVRELFKVEYNPTEELRLEGAFSLSKSVGHRDIFRPAQHTAFDDVTDPTLRGDYRRSQSESVSWGVDLTGSWNKQLRDHYLTANARMSVLENTSETFGNYVTGFPNDNMDNLLFGKKYNEKVTGLESTSRSIGWVAAGGYSYKYKYSFDFNIRLDGSSQFGKDNRWAPFWSTGLRWDLKKENFLKI